jgi:anti-anti-sigma regulatory factor
MLRISSISKPEGICLQLEGSLTASWVDELRRTVDSTLAQSSNVLLDLQHLWYVDQAGVELLRDLVVRRRLVPVNGSPFIRAQLETDSGGPGSGVNSC